MNLAAIRPSFNQLSEKERLDLILKIRAKRRFNLEAKKSRAVRAASKPRASKHEKKALFTLENITAEQAAQLLALIGGETNE